MGEQLFLSPHTVNAHLRRIFAKLGIRSRVELARLTAQRDTALILLLEWTARAPGRGPTPRPTVSTLPPNGFSANERQLIMPGSEPCRICTVFEPVR